MIKEALQYLLETCQHRPNQITIADRAFLHDPEDWREVRPERVKVARFVDSNAAAHRLGTIASLIDFIQEHTKDPCQVVVGHSGVDAYFDLDDEISLDTPILNYVRVPFNHPPAVQKFGYVGFQDFLDQHGERITNADALRAALRTFRSTDTASVKVKENGAIISIETTASKDLEGTGQSIPKELVIDLPTGTREFLIPNTFLLRIIPGSRDYTETQFILTKKDYDGSWEMLIELAFKKLKDGLPETALVLEGV
jgi:hypothetical protein